MTVSVLDATSKTFEVDPADVVETITRGKGAGGQHRNTTDSAVRLTHRPTGATVFICEDRSQGKNRARAWEVLTERLSTQAADSAHSAANGTRRAQIGSGMRGDKIRTYREQDDSAVDHRTNERLRLRQWLSGAKDFRRP